MMAASEFAPEPRRITKALVEFSGAKEGSRREEMRRLIDCCDSCASGPTHRDETMRVCRSARRKHDTRYRDKSDKDITNISKLLCILTIIVPITQLATQVFCQHQPQFQPQQPRVAINQAPFQFQSHQHDQSHLHQQHQLQAQIDWAQRLAPLSAQARQQTSAAPVDTSGLLLGASIPQRAALALAELTGVGRPQMMTMMQNNDIVNPQQTSLIRNLANATTNKIRELIPQPQTRLIGNKQAEFASQQVANQRMLPAMNKLYGFLFPNANPITGLKLQPQKQLNQSQSQQQFPFNKLPAEQIRSLTGNIGKSFSRSSRQSDQNESLLGRSIINLSAPYESRSRPSLGSNSTREGKMRREVLDLRASEQNSVPYSEMTDGQSNLPDDSNLAATGQDSDPQSGNPYEMQELTHVNSSSDGQQQQQVAHESEPNGDSYVHQVMDEQQPQEYVHESDNRQYEDPNDGNRTVGLHQNQQEEAYEQPIAIQSEPSEVGYSNYGDSNNGSMIHHQANYGPQSMEPGEGSERQRESDLSEIAMHQSNYTHHSPRNTSMEPYTSSEYQVPQTTDSATFHLGPNVSSISSAVVEDESSAVLAAQLPSQYDAVIRLPPEGYYDDYFKPATSNLAPQAPSDMLSSSDSANGGEFGFTGSGEHGPSSFGANYREAKQHQLDSEEAMSFTNGSSSEHRGVSPSHRHRLEQPVRLYDSGPTTPDYTAQFYLNQQPLKQQVVSPLGGDQSVEFIAPNKSLPMDVATKTPTGYTYTNKRPLQNATDDEHSAAIMALSSNHSAPSNHHNDEDAIHLIMANTNSSSKDPFSNEKVINYISEGRNVTLAAGKPPRSTFVNRDMNEFPAIDQHALGDRQPAQNQTEAPQSVKTSKQSNYVQLVTPSKLVNDETRYQANDGTEFRRPTSGDAEDENDLLRTTVSSGYGQYNGQRADSERGETAQAEAGDGDEQTDSNGHRPVSQIDRSSNGHGQARERRQRQNNNAGNHNYGGNQNNAHHGNQSHRGNSSPKGQPGRQQSGRMRQQQTIRRPQVTQANFNPKELPLKAPTPMPSVTESTMSSIAELPTKVKKLHENQPDKNELMSELLTALDKVKAAIYKLQPLTAKMNAIYRKSVTSSTRNIIMDHHKGTYAKRYPPGDYDDSYDRMHPTDVHSFDRSSRSSRGRRSRRTGSNAAADMSSSGSHPGAVYVAAPRDLRASNGTDVLSVNESRITATGVGRRLSNGRIVGQLSLSSGGDRVIYDDDDEAEDENHGDETERDVPLARNMSALDTAAPYFVPPDQLSSASGDDYSVQSPLFGYRITIFQSPESSGDNQADNDAALSYQLDELEANGSRSKDGLALAASDDQTDLMVTSESTVAQVNAVRQAPESDEVGDSGGAEAADQEDSIEGSGSSLKKKVKKKEQRQKKQAAKKEGEASKKSQAKKKKDEEESKKKKEYKKIKHNKGVLSKEKKTMHRDKHVKAHDRGAAKEKALKERTQIEFFEREQIVDDEFEKAKKSTMKAGWQSGKDSKKSSKDLLGDTISLGGSHYVKHEPKDVYTEKGHGSSVEASSAKESNKYEKKNMEAKGKKFKGWREKGYKIITETEFIDRGSLHDSAYKKRDKGAAHHQKYKKHELSSEGHQGSMQEHHKKSHKKEEKKSKMEEKKEEQMKKEEKEKKKLAKEGEKKKKMKSKQEEHDMDESAATVLPLASFDGRLLVERGDVGHELDMGGGARVHQKVSRLPVTLIAAGSSQFRGPVAPQQRPDSLLRLLNANHDDLHPIELAQRLDQVSPHNITFAQYQHDNSSRLEELLAPLHRHHNLSAGPTMDQSSRRSDNEPASVKVSTVPRLAQNATLSSSNSSADLAAGRANTTILDIVDTLTGLQLNKTKIGTYELEEQQGARNNPLVRLADYLLNPIAATNLGRNSRDHSTTSTTTTVRPQPVVTTSKPPAGGVELQNIDPSNQRAPSVPRKDPLRSAAVLPLFRDLNLGAMAKSALSKAASDFHTAPRNSQPELALLPSPEQSADEALELLQLLQRASQQQQPPPPPPARPSLMDFGQNRRQQHQQQQAVTNAALLQSSLLHHQNYYSPYQQQSLLSVPQTGQLSQFGPGGANPFASPEQLLDYEQELLSPDAHNLLVV